MNLFGRLVAAYKWAAGKKTYTAMALVFIAEGLEAVGQPEAAAVLNQIGVVLGAMGLVDKGARATVKAIDGAARKESGFNLKDWQ